MQVATRRTRTAGKVEIPNVDDHVSKLEHMGKETVKKLQDIKGSAVQSGIDINVPDNRIDKGERWSVDHHRGCPRHLVTSAVQPDKRSGPHQAGDAAAGACGGADIALPSRGALIYVLL